MSDNEIILRIEPISNGFLVSASKAIGYGTACLPITFVGTRAEVIEGIPSLFEAAELLSDAEVTEDF